MAAMRPDLLGSPKGRASLFTVLYLSEGAPMGFIWWALPTLLRTQDLPLSRITGLTSVLILPWAFKFLWAPLLDTWRGPRFSYRGWILCAQVLMGLALIPLIRLDPVEHFTTWTILLLIHALAASTQDVAIDALAIRVVPATERGRINGCMQAGLLLGRSLFAGGALWMAGQWGTSAVLMFLIGCIWLSLGALVLARDPTSHHTNRSGAWLAFQHTLSRVMSRRKTWFGLGFALTAASAFEAIGALAGPFLLDHGVSQETIGLFLAMPVLVLTMMGGLVGGPCSDRRGRIRTVAMFLVGFVAVALGIALTEHLNPAAPSWVWMSLLAALYLFIGLFTAASYALFMDLTDPRLGATQFSAFMAATNGCESWSGKLGGSLADHHGYPVSFAALSLVSLASLGFLGRLGHTGEGNPKP